jgi:hypothetical protein
MTRVDRASSDARIAPPCLAQLLFRNLEAAIAVLWSARAAKTARPVHFHLLDE